MTEPQPRPDVVAILERAGVDLDAHAQHRELALTVTAPVLGAAQAVIDHQGAPGASDRVHALQVALEHLVARDPVSAVVVAAAVWLDRYGSAGSPSRLQDLQAAVHALSDGPRPGISLEDAVESGEYTGRPEHLSDLFDSADEPEADYGR